MVFDDGDNWEFRNRSEEIKSWAETDQPRVIATGGKPPAQYERDDRDFWPQRLN
jgi:hypothetical protein